MVSRPQVKHSCFVRNRLHSRQYRRPNVFSWLSRYISDVGFGRR